MKVDIKIDNKNNLVASFLIGGLVLIVLSIYFSFFSKGTTTQGPRLAQVEQQTGKVFVFRSGLMQRELVDKRAPVLNLDSIETMETGEALLIFESAYRIRLLNSALVTLEKETEDKKDLVVLIVKRGEIKVENGGREGELFITKNGERIAATEYNSSLLAKEPITGPAASTNLSEPAPQGLTEEEISTVMASHRPHFFKCYTQLLQTDPNVKGNISLSFTIENSGKLSVAEVAPGQMGNQAISEDFKKCLLEVLKRIEFRPFQGPQISTLFPLKFE